MIPSNWDFLRVTIRQGNPNGCLTRFYLAGMKYTVCGLYIDIVVACVAIIEV